MPSEKMRRVLGCLARRVVGRVYAWGLRYRDEGFGVFGADYLEKRALDMAIEKLFLLTTRTADW